MSPSKNFGLKCPKCGRDDCIDIKMRIWARVSGSSADPYETHRFGGWMCAKTDAAACYACQCASVVADFDQGRGELEQVRMENWPTITWHLLLTRVVKEQAPRWLRTLQTGAGLFNALN